MDWLRWHHGTVDDAKLRACAKRAGVRVCEALAMWAVVMEAASQNIRRGFSDDLDFDVIDCAQEFEPGTAERLYREFQKLSRPMIDEAGKLTSWEKRQPKREDDTASKRKQEQRERDKKKQQVTDDVTQGHAESRDVTLDKIREDKKEHSVANATGAGAPTEGEKAEVPKEETQPPADPIWGIGLAFLLRKGIPNKQARELIGKLRKEAGDVQTGAILADCEAQDITNPAPWLMTAARNAKARAGPNPPQLGKQAQGLMALEAMKSGNAMATGSNFGGAATARLLGFGQDPRSGAFASDLDGVGRIIDA